MNASSPRALSASCSTRASDFPTFQVMQILARSQELQRRGRDIVSMVVGEPDFPTPEPIARAARAALVHPSIRYTPALGLGALRERIADWYTERYGLRVGPERVAVTTGGSGALMLACGAAVEPGSEVLIADPSYACNRQFVRAMEGRPIAIPVDASTHFQPTAAHIAERWTPRTAGAILTSPSNPTGTLIDPDALRAVAEAVRVRGGTLIVDEVYQELVYDTPPSSALAAGDDVVVIGSFSKFWSMTGWRLGWLIGPEPFIEAVGRMAPHLFVCAPGIAQVAALEAFSRETLQICEGYRQLFQRQRDYLLPELRRLGFVVEGDPRGAFHLYVDCSAFTDDSLSFCLELLEGAGVAMAPGCDFGVYGATTHLRLSYPKPVEVLAEGIARIEQFLEARRSRPRCVGASRR